MRGGTILLAIFGITLGVPIAILPSNTASLSFTDARTIGQLPSPISPSKAERPLAFQVPDVPVIHYQKRDGRWPWQKEQNVIGKYPDGRLKCSVVSMTAGHTEGPCPPLLPPDEVAKLLRGEWCRNNCCKHNGEPCGENYGQRWQGYGDLEVA